MEAFSRSFAMEHPENGIIYVEFPARAIPALKAFYQEAFAWTFTDYGPDYTCFQAGAIAGGFTTEAAPVAQGALVVLHNRDLEAAYARVVKAGGKIVKEIFPYPGGRRFHFSDPSGNVLAVCTED
jgi:predicted enzyme related to lactoylglutathione lyase